MLCFYNNSHFFPPILRITGPDKSLFAMIMNGEGDLSLSEVSVIKPDCHVWNYYRIIIITFNNRNVKKRNINYLQTIKEN